MKLNITESIRPRRLLAKILVPVALGGAVWGLSQYPAQAQTNGLTPPPAMTNDMAPDPQDGPDGPPAPPARDGKRGPNGRGPEADDRRPGPPERGPRDGMRPAPREGGPEADEDGPRRGPRGERPEGPDGPPPPRFDDEDGPRRRGPREGGPRDAGPEGRGPRDAGPDRERNRPRPDEFGPRDGRGPADGGPEGRGPRGDRGPREDGPGPRDERGPSDRGPRDAMDDANHIIGDVDAFGKISGDAYNVSGQAREYYQRALNAQKAGDQQKADELARVSVNLGHAAVLLAEEQTGKKLPEVRGDAKRERDVNAPKPPAQNDARVKRDAVRTLNRAYDQLGENKGQWNETARRLYTAARQDYSAGKFDSAQGRARAASHLVEAGRLLA